MLHITNELTFSTYFRWIAVVGCCMLFLHEKSPQYGVYILYHSYCPPIHHLLHAPRELSMVIHHKMNDIDCNIISPTTLPSQELRKKLCSINRRLSAAADTP